MKNLPIAIKILINSFFFFIYSLIAVILSNVIYAFILDKVLLKPVPMEGDPIYVKKALIVVFLALIFTIIFRKYFYIKLVYLEIYEDKKEDIKIEKKDKKSEQNFSKNIKDSMKSNVSQNVSEDMKIYFGKEIK